MKLTKYDIYRGLLFLVSLLTVGLFWRHQFLVFAILLGIFLEINRTLDWKLIRTSILCSIFGPIAEIIAINLGAWKYSNDQLLGISIWLAPLWGVASLFFISLSRVLNERI
jgi:hypothetical protein